jgi:hypothetical protein
MRRYAILLILLAACGDHFTPLQNRIAVGRESYVVFVADGQGGQGDLYAVDANGGLAYPFTYSLASESRPALDPTGVMLAFIRAPRDTGGTPRKLWVMNLLNGTERELRLDSGAVPQAAAWSRDGRTIFVRTSAGLRGVAAPPAEPAPHRLSGADSAAGDSALAVLVGDPPFATIAPCREGADDICALSSSAAPQVVDSPAHAPFRWGADSLGYVVGDRILVRPAGAGKPREVRIERAPAHVRDATWFAGIRPAPGAGG